MANKFLQIAATIVLVCAPILANAQPHGGGGGGGHPGGGGGGHPQGGGGGAPGGGGGRPAPMPMRQAPVQAPIRQAAPAGNFNFNHDIAPEQRAAPIARPVVARPVAARPIAARPIAARPIAARPIAARPAAGRAAPAARAGRSSGGQNSRPANVAGRNRNAGGTHVAYHRAPVTEAASGGAYHGHFNGQPIENRRGPRGNWAWNHGSHWHAANGYWGGGFWGDFALASIGGFALYGSIDDSQNGYAYDSYRVDADTPGAELLNDYQLEQAECGPPGLVDIWGPDGSVICAIPNDEVPPGNYQVDEETFTLVPAT
jgi:hypothetical protein